MCGAPTYILELSLRRWPLPLVVSKWYYSLPLVVSVVLPFAFGSNKLVYYPFAFVSIKVVSPFAFSSIKMVLYFALSSISGITLMTFGSSSYL